MKNSTKQDGGKREVAYPLYDLQEVIKVTEAVRDCGGGNSPVSKSILAQHLKYAENGPSFFQRVGAAKAFGLIDGWGSYSLTELAKQYFYPTIENGKQIASLDILKFPKPFSVLIQKFDGGLLPNSELLGNIIHKDAGIPVSKKSVVASCFVRSAQFLGVVDSGGFLRCRAFAAGGNRPQEIKSDVQSPVAAAAAPQIQKPQSEPKEFTDQEEHSFYLDKDRTKQVTLNGPLFLSRAEYDRICKWIDATWIIEDEKKNE
jgi:hypothetical protein